MATYTEHEQRLMDQAYGEDMDRRATRRREREAQQIAEEYGRDWNDCGPCERETFRDEAARRQYEGKSPAVYHFASKS